MQFYSYDLWDPVFDIDGLRVSLQLITKENSYGLPKDGARLKRHGSTWTIEAKELSWAGPQRRHGLGSVPYEPQKLHPGYWPTISFVEDTLEKAQTEVHNVIHLAKRYAEQFLQG